MFDGILFSVTAVDGPYFDAIDPDTDSLRFDGLTWDDAVALARLSFMQGFQVVIWATEDGENETEENTVPEKVI